MNNTQNTSPVRFSGGGRKYNIIYADPPWRYSNKACHGACENHYSTMSIKDICNLPISTLADKDCILFLWTTYPMLQEAIQVINAWGFKYKTIGFQWVKLNKNVKNVLFLQERNLFFGLGNWTRGNTEPCLIATKGKPHRLKNNISQIILEPIGRHSQKPDIVKDKIIDLVGDLPRIELFARQKSNGWDVWGNEVESDITI